MDVFALTLRLKEEGARSVEAAVKKMGKSFAETTNNTKALDSATDKLSSSLRALAGAASAAFGARALATAADSYTQITNQLRLATGSTDELATAQARVFAIAQQTAQPFAAVADLYARTGRAAAALGLSQAEVARVTEFVNQSIALSGSSAASASGAITQLGQALAAGRVQAEEFNSIQDGAPALISAVEKELGLQVGQLRRVALEGKLSSDVFVRAMLANTSVAQEFGTTQRTLASQLTTLQNAFTKIVGEINTAYDVTGQLNTALGVLRDNLPQVLATVTALAAAWGTYAVAVRSAAAVSLVLTGAQTIAAFVSLAKTVRSLADAAALLSLSSGGWAKIAATVVAIGGGVLAYNLAANAMEKATAGANKELDDLVATLSKGAPLDAGLTGTTAAVVDQVAALMQLVQLVPVTRVEAGLLAREERRLQVALAKSNLTYAERLTLMQRLIDVQKARAAMQVRLTPDELMASELDASRMIGMTGSGRALPQIRPTYRNGQLVSGGTPQDMIATAQRALDADAEKVRQRMAASLDATKAQLAEQMDQMRAAAMIFSQKIADTLVGSLAAGIERAIATGSLGEGFKALGQTLLSGLGTALMMFGQQAIVASKLMAKFMKAMASLNPFAALAAGISMVAVGAALRGAAQAAFGGGAQASAMGGGLGSLGVGGSMTTRTFAPTTAGGAGASVSAVQPMQVTIIGPNDPNAQRQIATLMDNAARRGLVQGAGVRTL